MEQKVGAWPAVAESLRDMQRPTWRQMDAATEEVLAEYEARQVEEDALMARLTAEEIGRRRDEFLVSVGRATGLLLNLLVRESGAHSILELGTAVGYSTIWLADAARATGGRVLTLDSVASKQGLARSALGRAGLLDYVEFQARDAMDFLASTSAAYDFVLLDLWKEAYVPCVDVLLGRLQPGATIVADNMLEPAMVRLAAARYQAHLRQIADLQTVVLSVGSGLAISRYRGGSTGIRSAADRGLSGRLDVARQRVKTDAR